MGRKHFPALTAFVVMSPAVALAHTGGETGPSLTTGLTIIFLLVLALGGIAVWWLSRQGLFAKPWVEVGAREEPAGRAGSPLPAAKVGLRVFLAVVGTLFALFISAYAIRMQMPDWQSLPKPALLWFNTAVLIASSGALHWTQLSARRERIEDVEKGLLAGGATAVLFLVGQLLVFRDLNAAGYFLASNPASSFFYLITSVHGIHLLGGLVALGRTASKVWHREDPPRIKLSVELCAAYWHFMLLVWLLLFGLILST